MSITERVERGAALLDKKRPGWWQLIDLGRLDIGSGCDCVAGQLCDIKSRSEVDYLEVVEGDLGLTTSAAEIAYGFDAASAGPGEEREFATLTEAWRDLITKRREGRLVSA